MLKNLSRLEHVIENKVYHFVCDMDSPLNQIKDSLFQFIKYVGQVEDSLKKQHEEAQKPQPVVEPIQPVVVENQPVEESHAN